MTGGMRTGGKARQTGADSSAAFAPRDFLSALSILIGFRDAAYRREAVDLLRLRKGDRVLEIGCGTGRNFGLLERAVGPGGRVVALDLSAEVIARAAARAGRHGWTNIAFLRADAADCEFPGPFDGVLATYTLTAVPDCDRVIAKAAVALRPGGRITVLDQRLPRGPASAFIGWIDRLSRPVNYSRILAERRPWESVRRHFGAAAVREHYFGFAFTAMGEKPSPGRHPVSG